MTTRLKIYNGALLLCGTRGLASLTEETEPRRLLDEVWNDGGVNVCLEEAQWKFAMRASELDYNASVSPDFGFQRAFDKPSDWVATSAVCSDEYYYTPLLHYADENGYWWADIDKLYVKYVSDHVDFGGDLSSWTSTFADYVKAHFAQRIVLKLSSDKERWLLVEKELENRKLKAKNKDAMAGPSKFPAEGAWAGARRGRGYRRGRWGDGGVTGSLTG